MKEEMIKRLIQNALKELESVDYTSNIKQIQNANNKKVQGAYNILFDLNRKLKEENNDGWRDSRKRRKVSRARNKKD